MSEGREMEEGTRAPHGGPGTGGEGGGTALWQSEPGDPTQTDAPTREKAC